MTPIDRVIAIAREEIGYLEKKTNNYLYDKTKNAGYNNFTKYWAEIKPSYQGEPWCACFVTWCFVKAFGRDMTEYLLRHYPFTYVPTIADLFTRHSNPQKGDIVCFYRSGKFCHTGIVTLVEGDKFYTIEGNTSSGEEIVANGGAVCAKSYYNSKLPGTKFVRPNYAKVQEEEEKQMIEEYKKYIEELQTKVGCLQGEVKILQTKRTINHF